MKRPNEAIALEFGSKAENLDRLQGRLQSALLPQQIYFDVGKWHSNPEKVLETIKNKITNGPLVVRSSANDEDSEHESKAGQYLSIGNVEFCSSTENKFLVSAINEVINAYNDPNPLNQVLVQNQVTDLSIIGVLFTSDIDTGAPYYTVTFDDCVDSIHSVTSGLSANHSSIIRLKTAPTQIRDQRFKQLYELATELEDIYQNDALDIEFAIDTEGKLYLLQVRPLVPCKKQQKSIGTNLAEHLERISQKLAEFNKNRPGLHGKPGPYSVMTDWNPAEMIGLRPRALARSLYKEIITDEIWAYQRDNYGYKRLRGYPLLINLVGMPYIDVRVSFNSFIPAELDDSISDKLVDYYTDELLADHNHHDKVEFNIVYSCYYLGVSDKLKNLQKRGFSELEIDRIKFALLRLTNKIIDPNNGLYKQDLRKIHYLQDRHKEVLSSQMGEKEKIYWLLQDVKRYGTLPFAGLARAGFIAIQFLKSFVDLEIISQEDYDSYLMTLNTVARQLSKDYAAYTNGKISKEEFLKTYGHLRPGSYDLLSPRYDQAFDQYFSNLQQLDSYNEVSDFQFSPKQKQLIQKHLIENGINSSTDELLTFISEAIEGREFGKFVFTRSLSDIIEMVKVLGAQQELSAEDLSHLNIQTIIDMYSNVSSFEDKAILSRCIEHERKLYETSKLIKLPQLVCTADDIYEFKTGKIEPNFVTMKRVTNIFVVEDSLHLEGVDLSGKIVLIESADPGYDWLFSRNIAGLVTMFGGANSHMAIRCAELGIPAVIGCGEHSFQYWRGARTLEIDCANKLVRAIF